MANIFARIQRPSLRWGLIFGIILGVVEVVYNFVASYITQADAQLILGYIPAILFIVLGFYAGMRASRETGKWTSGLVAGIWVGVIGTIIADLIPLANTFINLQSIVASSQLYIKTHPAQAGSVKPSDYTASDVIITTLLEMLVSVINAVFFTLVGGGLGGFMGRRVALARAASANQAYEETLFEPPTSTLVEPADVTVVEAAEVPDAATQEETVEAVETRDEDLQEKVPEPVEIKDEATK